MYAFVDLDPDGIAIMSTYKYGSYRLAHEDLASGHIGGLNLPNLRWLGLKNHHIGRGLVKESSTTEHTPDLQGLMRLTARDRTKATRMLEWDICAETGPEQEWRHGLQQMLTLNVKAEMQIFDEFPGGMIAFLNTELGQLQETEVGAVITSSYSDDGLLF